MNKIYYFIRKDSAQCYFFTDSECAEFYKKLVEPNTRVKCFTTRATKIDYKDIFTLVSFKEFLLRNYSLLTTVDGHISKFLKNLESKIRNEKLNKLLYE